MTRDEAFVRIQNLEKTYPGADKPAVTGLSLEIDKGSLFALVGPSGCGKTTTMRCVAGLETPDTGEIWVDEQLVFSSEQNVNVPAYRRKIGMVFQSYAIWPHMTVFDNVAYPLKNQRMTKTDIAKRVAEALELVGLGHMHNRPSPLLSGGEQQRVALARALVARPSLLLLDEPLSNLDAKLREHMRFELQEIQRTLGLTSIYVTHDQDEAFSLSDLMAIMNGGHVIEQGPPEDVYSVPQTSIGARFLGTTTELPGRVVETNGERTQVDTPVGRISCRCRQQTTVGAQVTVYLRPEDIHIDRPGGQSPQGTIVSGRISRMAYHGTNFEWWATINDIDIRGRSVSNWAEADIIRQGVGTPLQLWFGTSRCVVVDAPPHAQPDDESRDASGALLQFGNQP